ncbi:membrane protein UL56 [Ateline alphaherpesvirus 1]|uniref:Membrane protein UL56 n=1 Tax=Herpesvirus ateles type 1 (strain Lennette) TaxID=35243 RepID=A0A1S6JLK9_HSVA1|nr:membrane protein UL56 [Ateline alphaherpesvirus 1]AQS79160.1 membrane protein UL56 [Ateline alphaherpesvirus 1]
MFATAAPFLSPTPSPNASSPPPYSAPANPRRLWQTATGGDPPSRRTGRLGPPRAPPPDPFSGTPLLPLTPFVMPCTHIAAPVPTWPPLPRLPTYDEALASGPPPRPPPYAADARVPPANLPACIASFVAAPRPPPGRPSTLGAPAAATEQQQRAPAPRGRPAPARVAPRRASAPARRDVCRSYVLPAAVVCGYIGVAIALFVGIYLLGEQRRGA